MSWIAQHVTLMLNLLGKSAASIRAEIVGIDEGRESSLRSVAAQCGATPVKCSLEGEEIERRQGLCRWASNILTKPDFVDIGANARSVQNVRGESRGY